jgi:hypothetical protein
MARDALIEELLARGVDLGGDHRRLDRLLQMDTTFAEVGGGLFHLPSLLEGTSWTVWIDDDDARQGFVRMHPYLSPLGWWLIGDDVELVDESGNALGVLHTDGLWIDGRDTDVILGPDGWLRELVGHWAAVDVVNGALRWSACTTPPEPTEAQITAVRNGFERAVRTETEEATDRPAPSGLRFAVGDNPMHEALVADRSAFVEAAVPPLPALYHAAGLVQQDSIIAESDFDWEALRAWQTGNRLAISFGLDADQVERLVLVVGACQAFAAEGIDAFGGTESEREAAAIVLAGILEDGDVADAFWQECGRQGVDVGELGRFANKVAERLEPVVIVGLAWVRARCLDLTGKTAAAIELLEAAVSRDCEHVPALVELAGFAADRGDAPAAYRLLQRTGVTERDHDEADELDEAELLLEEVEGFALNRPRSLAGRNDPCPCGSGRKYKACHLGRERHPLEDRAGWLYQKARRFLRQRADDLVEELAGEMADPINFPREYEQLRDSPFVADLALHEEGLFGEFISARDGLLPDDEAHLAAQWALVSRGVFEIRQVERDRLDLYDVGSGERLTVVNTHPSGRTRPGIFMLGRPLPVGDTYRAFSGFVEVPQALVDDLLAAVYDGDASRIASLFGQTLQPPRLQNTDGENLVFHRIRWRVGASHLVGAALERAGLQADEGEPAWRLVRDSTNRGNTIVASLRLVGDELTGEVNSEPRADELRALIATVLPDAVVLDVEARSVEDALADFDPADASPGPDLGDPGLRQVLAEFIADQERRWLDESIPALGGRTPRDAAGDPIGREQLEQLLAGFPEPAPDDVGAMSPARLREALDL